MSEPLVAPFPYFGGKRAAAAHVWAALGPVDNYVEPFAGSLAVLLQRPSPPRVETVNDADGLLANVWRAMRADPDAVAEYADWPVNEADLHARHLWLVGQRESLTARLMADPDWHDAKAAGWWIWGACAWIGSGWCSGRGPWHAVDGQLVKGNAGCGINRQLPHLGDTGCGINRRGIQLRSWFADLSARLRDVRVACGDWSRVTGDSVLLPFVRTDKISTVGVFVDPPYGAVGTTDLYAVDSTTVADEVRAWCLEHGARPRTRIVLAGYAGQGHEALEAHGWRAVSWADGAGFASRGYGRKGSQLHRETLWLSPQCLSADTGPRKQLSLLGADEAP